MTLTLRPNWVQGTCGYFVQSGSFTARQKAVSIKFV